MKILMIATGGTIACKAGADGLTPALPANEILSFVPGIKDLCVPTTLQLFNIDSTDISPKHWLLLASAIRDNYADYDGFVILHGTDTMAYTAAVLSYLIQSSPKPIVITGAQKPIDLDVTDAKTNLYDSFCYCCSKYASGVNIVFDGKVILGTRARKTRSKSYNAFSSINYPCAAYVRDGKVINFLRKKYRGEPVFYDALCEKVGLFKLVPGASADVLDCYFRLNDAVIIESFGTGGIPEGETYGFYDVIRKWTKKGKIVVMCTQVENEGSDMTVYKVGRNAKKQFGFLEYYDMTQEATVAKLMWALAVAKTPSKIKKLFYKSINDDVLLKP